MKFESVREAVEYAVTRNTIVIFIRYGKVLISPIDTPDKECKECGDLLAMPDGTKRPICVSCGKLVRGESYE